MRYIAAYLLAVLGGHPSPTENEVVKILQASGVEIDKERQEIGLIWFIVCCCFGWCASDGEAASGAEAAKVVEKVVEEEEEIDMGGGMDMFGGDEDY
ncbi:unnamed protein product [Peronospora farinosa]|uniref:60S acidic ribosomal protein P2 n=1 Tax=Peronospora farinosa TaxID=134698 RepID=A0AAV0TES2_9STRA|nr:unnamed protein product [Peronospora farinosa]